MNIGAGPQLFGAAAMVACMMLGATPFSVPTKEFMVKDSLFYNKKKPVGLSKDVYDPKMLPIFKLENPENELVKAFRIWNHRKTKGWPMTDSAIIEDLFKEKLMDDIYEKGRKKVSFKSSLVVGPL